MKLYEKTTTRQGKRHRRRLEFAMFAPVNVVRRGVEQGPDGWVDELTDEEFGDVIGPSWFKLTGRNVDHLIPDHPEDTA